MARAISLGSEHRRILAKSADLRFGLDKIYAVTRYVCVTAQTDKTSIDISRLISDTSTGHCDKCWRETRWALIKRVLHYIWKCLVCGGGRVASSRS